MRSLTRIVLIPTQSNNMKKITLTLKRGTTAYNVKLGAPRQFLRVVSLANGLVGVVLMVDPTTLGGPCNFYALGNNDSIPAAQLGMPTYLGSGNGLDVFSPCFASV